MLKKVITIYLVLSVLIIITAAVGVFWYTKDKPQPSVNQPAINEVANTNQPTTDKSYEIIPPTKTDCTDELDTACWNTYRNNEYGYIVKYPVKILDIETKEVFEGGTVGNPSFKFIDGIGHFSLGRYQNKNNFLASEWLDDQYKNYSGGWMGYFLEFNKFTQAVYNGSDSCYVSWYVFSREKYFYTINFELCSRDENTKKLKVVREIAKSMIFIIK